MAKNIEVTLTLNSKQFNRGMNQAKSSMKGFSSQGNVTKGSIIGLAARLAPLAAGFVAVSSAVNQVGKSLGVAAQFEDVQVTLGNIVGSAEGGAAALNKIRDVARDLPVAFEELAASAPGIATVSGTIGELDENIRLAADIAGLFGIPFETAAGQIQRSFSAGAGAADVFREKGVLAAAGFEAGVTYSIDETIAKFREFGVEVDGSAEKLNKTYSGAVNQAGDAVTDFQAALGDAIKPEFQSFLENITKTFRDNEKQALEFAKTIGENVVSGVIRLARAVATVIDIVASMGQFLRRVGQSIRQNFGEQIRTVANVVVKAFGLIYEGIGYVGQGIGKLIEITTGVDSVSNFFENITKAANKLRTEGLDAIDDVSTELSTFIPVSTARDAVDQLVDDFTTGGAKIRADAQKTADAAKGLGDDLAINLGSGAIDASAAISQLSKDSGELAASLYNLLGGANPGGLTVEEIGKQIADAFAKDTKIMDAMATSAGRVKIAMGSIEGVFRNTIPTTQEYNTAIKFLLDNIDELKFSLPEITSLINKLDEEFKNQEGLRNFLDTIGQAQKSLSTDLATALLEGKSAGESFRTFFKTLTTQIIADALRLMIIQPILTSIFGLQFGSGGSVTGMDFGGSFLGGIFGGGKANGGPVMRNRPYLVGEKGPEIFVPNSMGGIVPNHAMGGTNVTYNINAVDAPSFQQLVASDPEFIFAVTQAGARRLPGG